MRLKENSALDGKMLLDLDFPKDSLIACIIRGDRVITPRGTTTLSCGDILYVLTDKKSHEKTMEKLTQ